MEELSAAPERWTFRLMGPFSASLGVRSLPALPTRKATALLAYLALHHDEPVERRELIELFWSGTEQRAGANSLSAALSSLRRAFQSADPEHDPPLIASRYRVGLDPSRCVSDAERFAAALSTARGAAQAAQQVHLRRALELYGTGLLPGLEYDWQPPERRLLRQQYLVAADELLDLLEGQGLFSETLEVAEQVLLNEPDREPTHRQVFRLLARRGEVRLAEERFLQVERRLTARGLEPSPDTVRLMRAVRGGDWQPEGRERRFQPRSFVPAGIVICVACAPELRTALARDHGNLVSANEGPAQPVVFTRLGDALTAVRRCLMEHRGDAAPCFGIAAGDAYLTPASWDCPAAERAQGLLAAALPGQVLCDRAVAAMARSEPPFPMRIPGLGQYILEDRGQLLSVLIIVFPELGAPITTSLGSAARPVGGLTEPPGSLIGREQDIHQLLNQLNDSSTRLLSLVGPAGCGKSRLAVAAGRRAAPQFGGRVWLAAMAGLYSPSAIVPQVLAAMRRGWSGGDPLMELRSVLGGRPDTLLVLDDLEHFLPAAKPILEAMLATVPELKLLITSRERCHLPGEVVRAVEPLAVPLPEATAAEQRSNPSIALFFDRARRADPSFVLDDTSLPAVANICRGLDGLPLAIELAARAVADLGLDMVAARFDEDQAIVGEADGHRHPRQRSLRDAFDWSYGLLSPSQQVSFRAMSVFAGGFDREAFEALAGPERSADLAALVNKSLLLQRETAPVEFYEPLRTVRAYAAGRAEEAGETDALRRRHVRHYASVAPPAWQLIESRQREANPYRLARLNLGNLVQALNHAAEREMWLELLRLAQGLVAVLLRENPGLAPVVQKPLLVALRAAGDYHGEKWTSGVASQLMQSSRWSGDHETVLAEADEAVALSHAAGLDMDEIYCTSSAMISALVLHRHESAARWFAHLASLRDRTDRPGWLRFFLAQYHEAHGQFEQALELINEASHQPDILASSSRQTMMLERYALIHAELGQLRQASEIAQHGLRLVLQESPTDPWLNIMVRIMAIAPLCWDGKREGSRHHARHAAGLLLNDGEGLRGYFGVRLIEQCLIADEPALALDLARQLFRSWVPELIRPDTRHLGTRIAAELWARNHFPDEAVAALQTFAAEPLDWSREPLSAGEGLRVAALLLKVRGRPREAISALRSAVGLLTGWHRRRRTCLLLLDELTQETGIVADEVPKAEGAEAALAAALGALGV